MKLYSSNKLNRKLMIVSVSAVLVLSIIAASALIWNYKNSSPSNSEGLSPTLIPTEEPCPSITVSIPSPTIGEISPSPTNCPTTIPPTPLVAFTKTPTPTTNHVPPTNTKPTATKVPTPTFTPTRIPTPTSTPFVLKPEICLGNAARKQMIFTFDGGAGTQSMQKILDVLQKHNVKGTFFTTGNWANQNQAYIKEISRRGHEIFNHTYTHPYLTKIPDDQIISELKRTEDLVMQLTGKTTKPFFRAPYGDRNTHVREVAGREGYQSVYWTVDALDWKESEGYTSEQVKQRIYANEKNGAIVLMHIGDNITGNILDEVFAKIKNDGYSIVPLSMGLY